MYINFMIVNDYTIIFLLVGTSFVSPRVLVQSTGLFTSYSRFNNLS